MRVKDIDLVRLEIRVRRGKGERDRVTIFPQLLIVDLHAHLGRVRERHERDLAAGCGGVSLFGAVVLRVLAGARPRGFKKDGILARSVGYGVLAKTS